MLFRDNRKENRNYNSGLCRGYIGVYKALKGIYRDNQRVWGSVLFIGVSKFTSPVLSICVNITLNIQVRFHAGINER